LRDGVDGVGLQLANLAAFRTVDEDEFDAHPGAAACGAAPPGAEVRRMLLWIVKW
jgi:hypothetical protein